MEPEKKSNGALVGLIIIVIILVLGGAYLWFTKSKMTTNEEVNSRTTSPVTTQDSSALDALQNDLNISDTNIDVDVNAVK